MNLILYTNLLWGLMMTKQIFKLKNGKKLKLPVHILRVKDLKSMGINYVEGGIILNKTNYNSPFEELPIDISKNMIIINYTDFSNTKFSEKLLINSIKEQIKLNSDLIILPYFKDETNSDIRKKLKIAEKLKQEIDNEIILEISYKSTIDSEELIEHSYSFDFLSIFYGVHYGHFNQLSKIIKRIIEIKHSTDKYIFCMAVPYKFSGDTIQDCRYMPCFPIISDGWIKNWKSGGGNQTLKLIDIKDYKVKTYQQWLETGHKVNELLQGIDKTVYEIFNTPIKIVKKDIIKYHSLIEDEIFNDISSIIPYRIEEIIYNKLHLKYSGLLLLSLKEKIFSIFLRKNNLFSIYSDEDKKRIESKIRRKAPHPSQVYFVINQITQIIKEKEIPTQELIKIIENTKLT